MRFGRLLTRLKKADGRLWSTYATRPSAVNALEDNLLSWEYLFTEEELSTRRSTRHWIENNFQGWLSQEERQNKDLAAELGAVGAFGIGLKGYGCKASSAVAKGLMFQELERGDSELRSLCSVQTNLVMQTILECGSEQQKKKYLPELQKGSLLGCFGLTEPSGQAHGVTARNELKSYVLNGVKTSSVAAPIADIAIIWAKVEGEGATQGFIVERAEGFATPWLPGSFSSMICPIGEIHLSGCKIGADQLLPQARGLSSALRCLAQAREAVAWGVTGAALACYETAISHDLGTDPPFTDRGELRSCIADMSGQIVTSQLLSLHYGRCADMQQLTSLQVSLHKRNNVTAALKVARSAHDLLGPEVLQGSCPIKRHLHNIETIAALDGTAAFHATAMSDALLESP